MKIRKAVLLLACAVSWGIAVWFAGRLWAAYPLVSVRSDVPVTGRQLEALRSALRQEDGASALVPAFWSQVEGSAESRWETCGITAILYCGEYDAVYPAVLLEGRFPAAQENGKCAVSTAAAWQLWGSEDVLGQELEIEGDIYRVCGLFRSSASLALCGESLDHGFSNIEFWGGYAAPPVETVQQLLRAAGIAQQVTLYFPFPWMAALTAYALCPAGLVLLAAHQAHAAGRGLDAVEPYLAALRRRGVTTREQALTFIAETDAANRALYAVFAACGLNGKPTNADRTLYKKWRGWGFGEELLLLAAEQSRGADNKLPYMDKVLEAWHEAGVTAPEQVSARQAAHARGRAAAPAAQRPARQVSAQQYTQREYTDEELNRQTLELLEEASQSDER